MTIGNNRTVLVIEDIDHSFDGLKQRFEKANWKVIRAIDRGTTLNQLEIAERARDKIDAIVLDLGLPPKNDDPMVTGLPLAGELRRKFPAMAIMAFTQLSIRDQTFSLLLAKLLPLRISLIYIRALPRNADLADLLEKAWLGYYILSPGATDQLPNAVPVHPDPLTDELWETLRMRAERMTAQQIAENLSRKLSTSGAENRLERARKKLMDIGELASFQTDSESLIQWYHRHYVRYRRDAESLWPQAKEDSL